MPLPNLPPASKPQIIHQAGQKVSKHLVEKDLLAGTLPSQNLQIEPRLKPEAAAKSKASMDTKKLPKKKMQSMTYSTQTVGWKVFTPKDGPIAQIQIPIDWRKTFEPSPDTPFMVYQTEMELSPPVHPEVRLIFGRANLLEKPWIQALDALLSKQLTDSQPHTLTTVEMNSLGYIIGRTADPQSFNLRHIFTYILLGVPVLFVEGQYPSSGAGGMCMTMLSGTDGPIDLNLEAPENPHAPEAESKENLYAQYRDTALRIFNSIIWKKEYAARFNTKTESSGENDEH